MTVSAPTTTRRRGPIARLDLETIVAAGLEIAARPGTKAVTVRELGSVLKADPTAIYRHVDSKDGLVRVLLDRLTGMALEAAGSSIDDWQRWLRTTAEATLAVFLRYPSIGAQSTHLSSEGEQELKLMEGILAAFSAAGLARADSVRFYGIYSVFVLSFCAGAASDRMHLEAPTAESPWVDRPLDVSAGGYPEIAASAGALEALTDVAAYRDGIELILTAAAAASAR